MKDNRIESDCKCIDPITTSVCRLSPMLILSRISLCTLPSNVALICRFISFLDSVTSSKFDFSIHVRCVYILRVKISNDRRPAAEAILENFMRQVVEFSKRDL